MRRRTRISVLAILVAGLVPATIGPVATAAATPRAATVASPHSKPCVVKHARCGYITRLLDPVDPSVGTVHVGFELHPHTSASKPPLEPIVAMEGGPGYATTASRSYYLTLFAPLRKRHDILFVDQRGTGMSSPINCRALQSYKGDYDTNAGLCGRQLGDAADVYGSAFAADDIAAVLDALHISTVDLYGDSYGTFLAQTFAVRHPTRLRTLVLDSAYPVEGQDPWYRDSNRALRTAFELACRRAPTCTARGGDIIDRIRALDDALRAHPLTGYARDADGHRRFVSVDPGMLAYVAGTAAYTYPVYRELDGAASAYLDGGDPAPLLRLAAEQNYYGSAGPVRQYSEGLADAVDCNDYPQLWDISSPIASRPAQYAASIAALKAGDPNAFDPFSIDDWISSSWVEYSDCIKWPVPSNFVPPLPEPHTYPGVPTLVLSGDLDSLTSPEGARIVAGHFPNSTFVDVHNGVHVTALDGFPDCAANIVVRFVTTRSAGDTSCAATFLPPVRMVEQFPPTLATVNAPGTDGRIENVALNAVSDLFFRWWNMIGEDGAGLRGGSFHTTGYVNVKFTMHGVRWVRDVAADGHVDWNRQTGSVTAHVSLHGDAGDRARLDISWNDLSLHPLASVRGTIDGHAVHAKLTPA
jgi:pimeloyl-ACP methyl ester carboxylesterase